MEEAETGPIRLYHPWETHSIGIQVPPCPLSPIPHGFKMNRGPQYVPFHIVNRDGITVPAKYIKVKMTNDPYAYGMLDSQGEVSFTQHQHSISRTYPVSASKTSCRSALITQTPRTSTTRWRV